MSDSGSLLEIDCNVLILTSYHVDSKAATIVGVSHCCLCPILETYLRIVPKNWNKLGKSSLSVHFSRIIGVLTHCTYGYMSTMTL